MLLVLARAADNEARSLVARWAAHDARVLSCADLSVRGWRYVPGRPLESRLIVGGEEVAVKHVHGMVVRLAAILPEDVTHIAPVDRRYAAAEMTSFLAAWLLEAPFPVVNRPLPACLSRPNWRVEQWRHAAASAGLKTADPLPGAEDCRSVTVVGSRCLGDPAEALRAAARRLACKAGVEFLTVLFNGSGEDVQFAEARPYPDVSQDAIADALLSRLLEERAAPL